MENDGGREIEAEQDIFKSGEEEYFIRRLRVFKESSILKLFSKVNLKTLFLLRLMVHSDLIIRQEPRKSLI